MSTPSEAPNLTTTPRPWPSDGSLVRAFRQGDQAAATALFERYAAAAHDPHDAGFSTGDGDGRITLLVSHRFSTVRMADLIVVLDGARVAEVGTHDELLARGGQYAELYGIQAAAYH